MDKTFDLRFGDIRYVLKSGNEEQILKAYFTNIYTYQIIKWELSINPTNFKNLLKIENINEIEWNQIHTIIEEIFTKNFRATFSVDTSNSTLFIKCYEPLVQELLGEFVIEIPKVKVRNVNEKFDKLEKMVRGKMEGPLDEFGSKILSKLQKLSIIFTESQLLTSFLENENNSLKKQNEVLKYEIENLEKEFLSKKKNQKENIDENKEDVDEDIEEIENKDYTVQELSDEKEIKKNEKNDLNNEMLVLMKKQLEKLDGIYQQMHHNQSLLEKDLKLKKKNKKEKAQRKEIKHKRIKGMEKSILPTNEMFILKNFLREAGVFGENSFVLPLYVATKNGFSASDFHRHCDFKPKNIVLIKANNYFFGGYTPCAWGSKQGWVENNDTFIFSLSNPQNTPVRMKSKSPQKSIYDFTSFGPIFGGGSDIYIADNCNQNSNSYSDLGFTFEGCPYPYSSLEAKDFLCGSSNFKVQEIEVYQVFQN